MLIIGDVHGKVDAYKKIVESYPGGTIQVGDFGFKEKHDWHMNNIDPEKHKINFGNHDYYPYLWKPHSTGNFTYRAANYINLPNKSLMTIRGADSIDQMFRTDGVDWFKEEEMNYKEWNGCFELYTQRKPQIIISHECPKAVRDHLFGIWENSGTSKALQQCFEIHQLELWIFGHHHESKDEVINGTRFICLAELETFEI